MAWRQTNDDVMGGVSTSRMTIDKNGHGVFLGNVSLDNNGGFAMTRLPVDMKITKNHKTRARQSRKRAIIKGPKQKLKFRGNPQNMT